MKYLINDSRDPYYNMAFDEWCLENLPLEEPVFYLWRNSPSVIIGLNQNAYSEVNIPFIESRGILLARRVTGGGAVYHDLNNLNYTIIGRDVTTEPFVEALRSLAPGIELSGRNDILLDGRKVSGYAKRVWKNRTMVHGTLMYDVDVDTLTSALNTPGSKLNSKGIASVRSRVANLKDYLPSFASLSGLQEEIRSKMAGRDSELVLDSRELEEIRSLRDLKFALWEWNYGRSPEADFSLRKKFSCGTVEAHFTINKGLIENIVFTGDFIGGEPSEILSDRLIGVRYERSYLLPALSDSSKYFDGVSPEDLLSLLIA